MEDKFIGKRLDGRYEIHELVGVGGMAYVYRAYDKMEDRWVAIKILKEEFSNDSDFLRRFRNESKAIALLSHPNIVHIYDVSFGDQIQYIVMEYVDGITLKQYIEQQGAIRTQETIHFMTQILSALELAHQNDIIHRDIKPQNILLLRDGTIKVTDFGIARFLQNETQTMTDKTIGSVHYISPEQASGHRITDKADIYSTGVMLYEMITGELPFVADTAVSVVIMQIQNKPRPPRDLNPNIPVGLEQITLRAMEKNPESRFRSAGEMLDDLLSLKQNPSIQFNYSYAPAAFEETRNIDEYDTVGDTHLYDDGYEESYDPELVRSKRRRKGSMAITGVVVALVLILIAVGAVYLINMMKDAENQEEDTIELPNFIGKIYDTEINGKEEYKDFTFKIENGNNPELAAGAVINQSPKGGIMVKKGREITLTVNGGTAEMVTVPPLTNYEQSEAIKVLETVGLKYKLETTADDSVPIGNVIRTDPTEGSEVPSGTQVTLFVSKGPSTKQVTIPENLIGDLQYNVTAKLEDLNLNVNIITDDNSDKAKDTVIAVNPGSGSKVSEGSSVDVTVSSGKGSPKTINYSVDLPSNVNEDLEVKTYRNGSLINTEVVNPAYASTYNLSLTGTSGVEKVVIRLNGQDYMYIDFDFDSMDAKMTSKNDYTPSQSGSGEDTSGDNSDEG